MKRRIVAGIIAAVLAVVSAGLVVTYTATADRRALAGHEPVTVLVVTEVIPAGTPVSELAGRVAPRQLPATAVVPDAVRSLSELTELTDRQAVTELQVGEQLLSSRFVVAGRAGTSVAVPDGLQELSVRLPVERVAAGRVVAGSRVGVLISAKEPETTTMAITDVLVTRVDRIVADGEDQEAPADPARAEPVTDAFYLVTVAVSAVDAQKLTWGVEHGTVLLTLQNDRTDDSGRTVLPRTEVKP